MTGASGLGTWVKGSVAPVLASKSASSLWEVQRDLRLTESLELHGRRGSQKDPKYPKRTLVGETLAGPWRGGQGTIESQLGKRPIESRMFLDGSDTIPSHVQGTLLRLADFLAKTGATLPLVGGGGLICRRPCQCQVEFLLKAYVTWQATE